MATPRIPRKCYERVHHRPSFVSDPNKVPFKAYKPVTLKDKLTGRDSSGKQTPCVGHLLDMFDCLKRTGFIDGPCRQQISAYSKCNEDFKKTEKANEARAEEDISHIKSTKDMKREQLNVLLKRFHTKS